MLPPGCTLGMLERELDRQGSDNVDAEMECCHPGCAEIWEYECDNCSARFCPDHGSKGGDRETEGGLVACPSLCFRCGGFNADAE